MELEVATRLSKSERRVEELEATIRALQVRVRALEARNRPLGPGATQMPPVRPLRPLTGQPGSLRFTSRDTQDGS